MCKNPINPAGNEVDAAVEPKSSQTKLITNAELRQHNVPGNAWAAVHGKVLDITDFAKRHPGGDLILLAAGKDASVLFETYHPRGVPESLVNKLTVSYRCYTDQPTVSNQTLFVFSLTFCNSYQL